MKFYHQLQVSGDIRKREEEREGVKMAGSITFERSDARKDLMQKWQNVSTHLNTNMHIFFLGISVCLNDFVN